MSSCLESMRTGEEEREEKVAHIFQYEGAGEGGRMCTASGGAVGSMRDRTRVLCARWSRVEREVCGISPRRRDAFF